MAAQAPSSLHVCMDDSSDWLKSIVNFNDSSVDNSNSISPSTELISYTNAPQPQLERRLRPPHDHPLKCPRCDSSHTKFCYYNNYSLSQPRYFCKTCRRYWTKGGSLRNVPVGGGCRKTKKRSSAGAQQPQPVNMYRHSNPLTSNLDYFNCAGLGIEENGCFNSDFGFSLLGYEKEDEVKPMLSLEWPENGCGSDLFGGYGLNGLWAGMVNGYGNGSSSSAAM